MTSDGGWIVLVVVLAVTGGGIQLTQLINNHMPILQCTALAQSTSLLLSLVFPSGPLRETGPPSLPDTVFGLRQVGRAHKENWTLSSTESIIRRKLAGLCRDG